MTSTGCSLTYGRRAFLRTSKLWPGRLGTANAALGLCLARLLVDWVPFVRWRRFLGQRSFYKSGELQKEAAVAHARNLSGQVERAAVRLPFEIKCLPRAMALSWLLRRQQIGHSVVFAVRPADLRSGADKLHAWVEVENVKVIGELPGRWIETLRLGNPFV